MKSKLMMTAVASVFCVTAYAETLSVVGSWSNLPLHNQFEKPYWTEVLPKASNGQISVTMTTHNQMGTALGDVFTLLGDGVYDVAMTVGDYAVADAPELEGLDVPLVALTADQARAMVDAARPMVDEIFRDRFNSHVLAIAPYPPQIVFCRGEVKSLDDLKGKKVRGSGRMTAKFLEALGAEGVNVNFAEVPGALQKGVIDCAVTGAGSGYSAGWWEVSDHLLVIPIGGWDPVVTAINLDKWNSMSEANRKLITDTIKTDFEDPAWEVAQTALVNDIACLTGNGPCAAGDARNMTLVEVSDADFNRARTVLVEQVLPDWAARAGGNWGQRWSDTVGKVVGVTIK